MSDQNIHATRLKSLTMAVRNMRNAQRAYFSLPGSMSRETKAPFLATSKKAEEHVDALVKQIEFEKLV